MSKRILVVEDQEDNRQIIRDMLSATDYQITEAENGEQALAAVMKQRPDLILIAGNGARVRGLLPRVAAISAPQSSSASRASRSFAKSSGNFASTPLSAAHCRA
jgi:DNA-binding NtrC family response regulator